MGSMELPRPQHRFLQCCQHLLTQGSCLHGKVVQPPRNCRNEISHLACWYCSKTFEHSDKGISELQDHGNADHGQTIAAWIRKNRKNKARQHRVSYQNTMGEARRILDVERQVAKSM